MTFEFTSHIVKEQRNEWAAGTWKLHTFTSHIVKEQPKPFWFLVEILGYLHPT